MPNFQTLLPLAPPAVLTVGAAVSPGSQVVAYICVGIYMVFYLAMLGFLVAMCVMGKPEHVRNARWALNLLLVRRNQATAPPSPSSTPPTT